MGYDPKDHPMAGTGDELGRITIPGIGEFIVEDDSYDDADLTTRFVDEEGKNSYLNDCLSQFRYDNGDEALMDALDGKDPSTPSGGFDRAPPTYKCAGCELTWPRSSNTNPGSGDDLCPKCGD